MDNTIYDLKLDCRGLNCPLPVLKTKKTLDDMAPGDTLKIISNDPGSKKDIESWTKISGNKMISIVTKNKDFIFYIKKS